MQLDVDGTGSDIHIEKKEVIIAELQRSGGLKVKRKAGRPRNRKEQKRKNETKRVERVGPK